MMHRTIVVFIALLFSASVYGKPQERLDIDPVLHGVWYVHSIKGKKEKKFKRVKPPAALCKVSASKVTASGGSVMRVVKVLIIKDSKGNPGNAIKFNNGMTWAVFSSKKGGNLFLLQAFDPSYKEVMRAIFEVK